MSPASQKNAHLRQIKTELAEKYESQAANANSATKRKHFMYKARKYRQQIRDLEAAANIS